MPTEARDTIASYVATGSLRPSDNAAVALLPERQIELTQRLETVRAGGSPPSAEDDPTEFALAIREREEQARLERESNRGADVPRWNQDNSIMRGIYTAHDTIVSLPAPGGLGLLILVIVLFFLILIPATSSGETRSLLLWEVLLGKKEIYQERQTILGGEGVPPPPTRPPATDGSGSLSGQPTAFSGGRPEPTLSPADMPWLRDTTGIADALGLPAQVPGGLGIR